MYCGKCGKNLGDDFTYCPNCGTKRFEPKVAATEHEETSRYEESQTQDFTEPSEPLQKPLKGTVMRIAIFLGLFGAHRFYVDRVKGGFANLAITSISIIFFVREEYVISFTLLFLNLIAVLADIIAINDNEFTDANGQPLDT